MHDTDGATIYIHRKMEMGMKRNKLRKGIWVSWVSVLPTFLFLHIYSSDNIKFIYPNICHVENIFEYPHRRSRRNCRVSECYKRRFALQKTLLLKTVKNINNNHFCWNKSVFRGVGACKVDRISHTLSNAFRMRFCVPESRFLRSKNVWNLIMMGFCLRSLSKCSLFQHSFHFLSFSVSPASFSMFLIQFCLLSTSTCCWHGWETKLRLAYRIQILNMP